MFTESNEETILVVGAGPAGLCFSVEYMRRHPDCKIVVITAPDVSIHPRRYFEAWALAAGYGQPFQSHDGMKARVWFQQTLRAMRKITLGTGEIQWGPVHTVHNGPQSFRPEWAQGLETHNLDPMHRPDGYRSGFGWMSYTIDPSLRHAALVAEAVSLGIRINTRLLFNMEDIHELNAEFNPTFIVDALGISSSQIFGDDEMAGKIGHLLVTPNQTGETLTVMDDEGIRYVIAGPRNIFVGGTYIDVEAQFVPYANLNMPEGFAERSMETLRILRPEIFRTVRQADLFHQVGIRPYRETVRIEFEDIDGLPPVLHITGLGGSGWSICHGVAISAADEIDTYRRASEDADRDLGGTAEAQTGTEDEDR